MDVVHITINRELVTGGTRRMRTIIVYMKWHKEVLDESVVRIE
jgi:hypothetical protein